jgi:ketosteroid isomerase-like protein
MLLADTLTASDVAAINEARRRWFTAMNADDVNGLVMPLTEDVVVFPPNESPLVGLEGSRAWHKARVDQFTTELTIASSEVSGGRVWAFDQLYYTIRLTPRAGGSSIHDSGPCIWIWRRETDGRWRIARAIWNSEKPPQIIFRR